METLLAEDVEPGSLAHQYKLSCGNAKNIALADSFQAAADGGRVTMTHLRNATRREYQKVGKVLSDTEFNGSYKKQSLPRSL
jgi:hypothetical protein